MAASPLAGAAAPVAAAAARRFLAGPHQPPDDLPAANVATLPSVYKRYAGARRIVLPTVSEPGREGTARIGSLLAQINGVTRMRWMSGMLPLGMSRPAGARAATRRVWLTPARPAPSSGARYPIEAYLAVGDSEDLPAGLYHYDPAHHALDVLREGDVRSWASAALADEPSPPPAMVLLLSTVFWRNAAKYRQFGYRLQCLDAGVMVGQALEAGAAAGLHGQVHLCFHDEDLNLLAGLDPLAESVLAVITFPGRTESRPMPLADRSLPVAAVAAPSPPITDFPEFADMADLHLASLAYRPVDGSPRSDDMGEPFIAAMAGSAVALPTVDVELSAGLARRRTAYGYHQEKLDKTDLAALLAAAARPSNTDPTSATALCCAVPGVADVEPGPYRYLRGRHALSPLSVGDPVDALAASAKSPMLAEECRTAGAVLSPVGDFERGLRIFGDRWYRMQNIQAGLLTQRVCLAAAARGLASHVHCDFDIGALAGALGLGDGAVQPLVLVTVGRSRPDRVDPQSAL